MRITLSTGTTAELARPTSGEPVAGLVLWPDVFGLRPLFDEHCQRLADAHHWVVVCPEPYSGKEHLDVGERLEVAGQLDDDAKLADTIAAADACGFDHVGALGFCMGGMYAMKALASDRVDRAVAFYGMVRTPPQWQGHGQGDALDVVAARQARGDLELLCIFGTEDPWCPLDEIALVEQAGAEVIRYEGAGHGWAQDPNREGYRAEDAADAWRRAEIFLAGEAG